MNFSPNQYPPDVSPPPGHIPLSQIPVADPPQPQPEAVIQPEAAPAPIQTLSEANPAIQKQPASVKSSSRLTLPVVLAVVIALALAFVAVSAFKNGGS